MNKSSLTILFMLSIVIVILGFLAYKLLYSNTINNGNDQPIPSATFDISITPTAQPTTGGIQRIFSQKGVEIQILSPNDFSQVKSPLVIEGEVKGPWYFEGSFPIKIATTDGKEITIVPAQALKDWMSEDWVSFRAELNFDVSTETEAQIIFMADNPSGLPENDDSAIINTVLVPATNEEESINIKLFFNNNNFDPNTEYCERTYEVNRTIPKTEAVAKAALEELLKGPNMEETAQGYLTSIPSDAKLKSVNLKDGVLTADFETLGSGIGGSCLVGAISSQIENTLKQFPSVQEVKICEMGECEMTLQP